MDALIGGHGGRGVDVGLVGGAVLGSLREGQHKHRTEVPRQEPQHAGP